MFVKRFLSLFLLLVLPTLAMQRMHDPWERMLPNLQRSSLRPQLQKSHHVVLQGTNTPWNCKTFKYDDILTFLNDLESGELEKRCSDRDLEQINQFVADLAREGLIPNLGGSPQDLEQDIEELLGISDPYAFRYAPAERSSYALTPALYYGDHEVLHCGWFKKAWKKTKKFCKKHKKAIIIGAVVVVAVTTIVVVAVVASSSTAVGGAAAAAAGGGEGGGVAGGLAAAGGAAAAGAASTTKKSDDQPSATPGVNDAIASRPDPTPPAPPQSPKSQSPPEAERIVEKHIENFKEAVAEERPAIDLANPNEPLPFEETMRVHGANTAQSACREIAEAASPELTQAPSLIQREISSIASAFGLVDQKVGIVAKDGSIIEIPGAEVSHGLALPVPSPATVAVVAGAGYAAYEVGKDSALQQSIANGLDYAKDKVLDGVEYVRDRVIEAGEAIASWAAGAQPIASLESRSGEGVADDRVLQPQDEYFENFPDRNLPHKPGGEPMPDVDVPHTQLGTREGGKGKYRQSMEFDKDGKPVRRIDWTDHGRADHTNPHQHRYVENETGGTRTIEDAEPVPELNQGDNNGA